MNERRKIGLIGLDTSHVVAFAQLFNDPKNANHIPGARVAWGFPGPSPDFDLSVSRVEGFTKQLRDEFGVAILDSPEAVAERSDLVFITAVDGRAHRALFERIARFKRPTFIDKPFTTCLADAKAIMDLAERQGVAVMSCSSLRYADLFVAALADTAKGALLGVDVWGPMEIRPPMPGLYWYGCHTVEMMVAAMGAGCRRVQALATGQADIIAAEWADGRMAALRGMRPGQGGFGATLHREQGFALVDCQGEKRPTYAGMLEAVMRSLPLGRSDVPHGQMIEVVRIIDAANESRETGRCVTLPA